MTVSAPPAFLRWVVPAAVIGALMVLALLFKVQHDRVAPIDEPRPVETTAASELTTWLEHTAPIVASLRSTFGDVGEAAMASDFTATSTACRAGLELTGELGAELPSPNVRLNDGLRVALDDYEQALRHCVAGSENSDPAELAMATNLVAVGDRHWRAAVGTLGAPWPGLPPRDTRPSHVYKI
jgi:hypothetical protein